MDEYDEILQFYQNDNRTEQETKKWCFQKFIALMFKFMENPNSLIIKNSIILMLNLFFVENPDHYHSQGKKRILLDGNEKTKLLKTLTKEIEG